MGEKGGKMRKCTSGALAALGGFASGVFGALGGIVLNRITAKVNPKKGGDAIRDNYACTLFIMIAVSAVSAAVYALRGEYSDFSELPTVLAAGCAGGISGGVLCDRVNTIVLKGAFAAITIWAGIRMRM